MLRQYHFYYCSKNGVEVVKNLLDETLCNENGAIYRISGIRKAHLFIKGAPYTIGFQKIVADDYAELSLRTVKFVRTASTDVATKTSTAFICEQGE